MDCTPTYGHGHGCNGDCGIEVTAKKKHQNTPLHVRLKGAFIIDLDGRTI